MKDMDGLKFVKVIPVVLVILKKPSRSVKKIPAARIRFFGLLVQLFGGNTFRLDSAALECKRLSNVIYRHGRASEILLPFRLARAARNVVFNIAFTPSQDSRKHLPLWFELGSFFYPSYSANRFSRQFRET
jgi:hypothetical protein